MELKRYFIEFSYDGLAFHGWQRQPNALSVQEVIEDGLSKILKRNTSIIGAGRTDTGVHARQMFAHFNASIKEGYLKDLVFLLNNYLPKSINIISLKNVKVTAHARFDAIERCYEYYISTEKDPFNNSYHYFLKNVPDINLMNKASKFLLNHKDFKCFSKSNTDVKTFLCEIKNASWSKKESQIVFSITSNRFLRNMVRSIVGTLLEIGLKKRPLEDMKLIIESKDRSKAGFSVPAKGLFLTKIIYPSNLYLNNEKE
tara:strand:+ start:273 stop:1043 length:771 start_codon:yes stop_codon:yes gene_type:complete